MKVTCYGAAGCVTGSCFLIDNGSKILVDCGLFQGGKAMDALNREPWPFSPSEIDALLLTHAHIDHCGRIPKLVRDGFRGPIYTTPPTAELCKILLLDSAHIQEMEAEWKTRKNLRRGLEPVEPLYTTEDAERCFPLFQPMERDQVFSPTPAYTVRLRNAGHILGSSILEIWDGDGRGTKLVFSGDIGRKHQLIVKDPEPIFDADMLFIESTYGNRRHRSFPESLDELTEAIHTSYQHGQKVLIPAFAVERTQEILYVLGELLRSGKIPRLPIYLDSPLAIAATKIFQQMRQYYDEDAVEILKQGHDPFSFPELVLSKSADDSKALNLLEGPAVIIAGNGMCTAGRIKHHLKHNLWKKGCSLVIVGYQAEGSLGRRLIEGARSIRIFGEEVVVRAKIHTIGGFSAHADRDDLLEWISNFKNPKLRVVVIHGEKESSAAFAGAIQERFGHRVWTPTLGQTLDVSEDLALERVEPAPAAWLQQFHELEVRIGEVRRMLEATQDALDPETRKEIERISRSFLETLEKEVLARLNAANDLG
ncbi:metallo-beta-lactamase family protein [Desulfacinum hydrothermale DSM 13146]|uniref:Metallo-beta-lactamase family protein n=1 Tax=Desulfacinum hydrothermale DSM 13146 TaxID=1121390 RepID=A0A1W1XTR3_9BACT|nr:MBL fold metallo-hydrolase [Desulfacinum hydrothermale]SMC26921.1 metallo-beta-lactamase family protein [Desulfacinum hydrothermale DSM 13146]